jgi:hypothetical protein
MIVAGRLCDLCGEIVTSRTIHAHYANAHGTWHASDWQLTCWPDGQRVTILVEDETLELALGR